LDAVSTPNLESLARCLTFTNQYGIVSGSRLEERIERVHGIVEKNPS
jgi:UTP-glucose-1-phosphate uridylyltransferase